MKHLAIVALLSLPACGKGSDGAKSDWATKALQSTTVNLGQTAFQIDIPEGLEISVQETERIRWIVKSDEWNNPNIEVSTERALPDDLAAAKSSEMVSDDAKFTSEKKGDGEGMVLSYMTSDGRAHYSYVWKTLGTQVIKCQATFAKDGGPPATTAAWLEKLCTSIKAK